MSHTPNTFAGEFDMLTAERAAVELIIGRKMRIEELYMMPQLMRCKSDDAIRLLMRQRDRRDVYNPKRKGMGHRASVRVDSIVAENAA